jgi:hypothetical protein
VTALFGGAVLASSSDMDLYVDVLGYSECLVGILRT